MLCIVLAVAVPPHCCHPLPSLIFTGFKVTRAVSPCDFRGTPLVTIKWAYNVLYSYLVAAHHPRRRRSPPLLSSPPLADIYGVYGEGLFILVCLLRVHKRETSDFLPEAAGFTMAIVRQFPPISGGSCCANTIVTALLTASKFIKYHSNKWVHSILHCLSPVLQSPGFGYFCLALPIGTSDQG